MTKNALKVKDENLEMDDVEMSKTELSTTKQSEMANEFRFVEAENASFSLSKSLMTSSTFASGKSRIDSPIEQVEKDHYLYRRGSTAVHVQAYSGSSASELDLSSEDDHDSFNGVSMVSVLLGILLFLITLTIKMSTAISDKASASTVDQYLLTLYVFGTLWTSYYMIKGFFKYQDQLKFLKSGQKSNRWLKGVIVLFGLAIVLKNILNLIVYFMIDVTQCSYNSIKIAILVFQVLFIMSQTKYIFRYSKSFIRTCCNGSRTGLMLVIAINLSTWLCSVIDEALHALHEGGNAEQERSTQSTPTCNTTAVMTFEDHDSGEDDVCSCTSEFCSVVEIADKFLFPFLIEYSLVASSLIYVTWENVGKKPSPCEKVIKPSYKFYGRYRGSSLGCIVTFLTIIFMILLGTSSSDAPEVLRNYFTENYQLFLYNCYLFVVEILMLVVTIVGFYLFYRIPRPLEKPPLLDQILVVGCVLGPLVNNLFSLIAVISVEENRISYWVFTLIQPLTDTLQCILQVFFILYGLRREPITSVSSRETNEQLKHGLDEHFHNSNHGEDNKTFIRSRRKSLTSMVVQLATGPDQEDLDSDPEYKDKQSPPDIIVSPTTEDSDVTLSNSTEASSKYAILKIVSEVHVARPNGARFWLRDVIMFLLIGNACLWIFFSLSGTAFTVFPYQTMFYGGAAWTTISMICRPLHIFFRMHSAGCLFEMWSFA